MKINKIKLNILWNFLCQPSTKRGIIGLAAMCGIAITPDYWAAIAFIATTIFSILEILYNENAVKEPVKEPENLKEEK